MKNLRKSMKFVKKVVLIALAILAALTLISEPEGELTFSFVLTKILSLVYLFMLGKANHIIG